MSFHGKCPVGPNRASNLNTPCDMKKAVDGQNTGGQSSGIIFVVQPVLISVGYVRGNTSCSLFVFFYPQPEAPVNLIQHHFGNLKCQTKLEKLNKPHEMFVVSRLFKPPT